MCGICGFIDDGPDSAAILASMNASLIPRGPDGAGLWSQGRVHLAMRRLVVVDPQGGTQPVSSADGRIHAVFNGEIYNHAALRRDLEAKGHRFTSDHSDSEVIVPLYQEHGDDWPNIAKVNGMFAVALWDEDRQRLVLYRDRMGKKPLYWAALPGGGLAFGSEPKALLKHPKIDAAIDPAALWHYFSLKAVPAPLSIWQGLAQLSPGHRLIWENGGHRVERWYRPDFTPPADPVNEADAARTILDLLDDSVALRLQADVPVGVALSGGLDSSAVAALARRHHSGPLKTFCLSYADGEGVQMQGKANDAQWSRRMAQILDTEHHELCLSSADFVTGLPGVMGAFDEPFSGTVSTYFLSAFMRPQVVCALAGDGADELFGSYLAHRLADPIARFLAGTPITDNRDLVARIAHADQAQWRMALAVFSEAEKQHLLADCGADTTDLYAAALSGATAQDPLNAALELDQLTLLPDQVLAFADRLSMAHGLEMRAPFLDHRLVAWANSLPGSMKIRQNRVKHILKQAVVGLLPAELVDRPKEGFVQPVYTWMRGPLRIWLEDLLDQDRLDQHGFVNAATIRNLLSQHFGGSHDHGAKLWALACFQIWWETVARAAVRP